MFIKSLTIKNFRCFDKNGITVNFNERLTAFIGKNGSGKTSILEALNFLIGQDYLPTRISEKDFHHEAKGIKEQDAILIEGETKTPFFFEVDVITNETKQMETVIVPCKTVRLTIKRRERAERVLDDPFIITKTVIPITGTIDDVIYQGKDFKRSHKIVLLTEIDREVLDIDTAKEIIKNLLMGQATNVQQADRYYEVKFKLKSSKANRTASFPSYNLSFNLNKIKGLAKSYYLTKNRDDDVSGSYSLISKILTDLHWRYKRKTAGNDSLIKEQYDTLAGSLRNIVDEKGQLIKKINEKIREISSDDKDFQIDFVDMEQPYKSAFVAKKEGEKLLLPEHLGSGYNILIAYALFAYVANLEKIPIVLIIDEPELYLHSDWQKKMYDVFVKQTSLQIIYSTQSENFISLKNWREIKQIKNAQIFPKQEVDNSQTQATDGETGTPLQYLDDYAQKNLHISLILRENLELFFTKRCILVEGPSEKYALPKLLKLSGFDVENFSISIISAWGKTKIKNYQMICKYFGVEYYTIFDQDKAEDNESTSENIAIENNAQDGKITKFSTSFEAKLGITGNNKFQKLVKMIDGLSNINLLDQEIKDCVDKLKTFIDPSKP